MEQSSIGIVSKASGIAQAADWGMPVVLQETSLVKLPLSLDMVQAYDQQGEDLIIRLHNAEQVHIQGFFTEFEDEERSELVLEGEDGGVWLGSFDSVNSEFVFSEASSAEIAAAGDTLNSGAIAIADLMSTEGWVKAGGTGLNLTSAERVIHFDPWWNPAVENQATDRKSVV